MPKRVRPLTERQVAGLSKEPGVYADGGGLSLRVRVGKESMTAGWVYRYSLDQRVNETGLGTYPEVTLRAARLERDKLKALVKQGIDPVREKRRIKEEQAQRRSNTFEAVAARVHQQRAHTLKGKNRRLWLNPASNHLFPTCGSVPISDIDQHHLYRALKDKWLEQHGLCKKVLQIASVVLKEAEADGMEVNVGAVASARRLLNRLGTPAPVKHQRALDYFELPKLYQSLNLQQPSQRLIAALILTGQRVGSLVNARWDHVDFNKGTLTIPYENLKSGKPREGLEVFKIPLTAEMRRVLTTCAKYSDGVTYIFTSTKPDQPISSNAPTKWLKENNAGTTSHGFRSSIRTFSETVRGVSYEAREALLNHAVLGQVQSAYYRSSYFDDRKVIHEAWDRYLRCMQSNVVRLGETAVI
jgi:integrase